MADRSGWTAFEARGTGLLDVRAFDEEAEEEREAEWEEDDDDWEDDEDDDDLDDDDEDEDWEVWDGDGADDVTGRRPSRPMWE